MSQRCRLAGFAAATAMAISAVTFSAVSPASATATASLAADGNGGIVVTYSGTTANDNFDVVAQVPGSSCPVQNPADEIAVLTTDPSAPAQALLSSSPASIVAGTTMYFLSGGLLTTPGPIPAGQYTFCLSQTTNSAPAVFVASLTMTLGQVPVTTTATVPSADPVTPTFTG